MKSFIPSLGIKDSLLSLTSGTAKIFLNDVFFFKKKMVFRAREMAQQLREPAALAEDLSLVSSIHMVARSCQ